MTHPFEKLSAPALRKLYWVFLALTALVAITLGALAKYRPDGAPADAPTLTVPTVQFEFARTPADWTALSSIAGDAGMHALKIQTYADYLFLLTYSTLLAAAVIGVTRGCRSRLALGVGRKLAWGQWLAALMDAIENAGLIRNCSEPVSGTWTQISSTAAAIKFALIIFAMLYIYIALACSWRDDPA